METKPLLYGLIGFFIGGLLVAIAATMSNKPNDKTTTDHTNTSMSSMSMSDMAADLEGKTGDEFDKAFLAAMIVHHEGAVEMAELSAANAKHEDLKMLSRDIISAQEKEITAMKQWQQEWGYSSTSHENSMEH